MKDDGVEILKAMNAVVENFEEMLTRTSMLCDTGRFSLMLELFEQMDSLESREDILMSLQKYVSVEREDLANPPLTH